MTYHLLAAKKEVAFPLENSLFAVEAWVPANKTNILYSIIDGMAIHCEPIPIEERTASRPIWKIKACRASAKISLKSTTSLQRPTETLPAGCFGFLLSFSP